MQQTRDYARNSIVFLFYALFFFTPLIFWPYTSEVFEFNKMLFVYIITILIGFSWAALALTEGKLTIRKTPLDIPILIFFLTQLASTIFSIDPHTSIWGYYSRFHGGLASTTTYIVLYYALVTHFLPEGKVGFSETTINPKVRNSIYVTLATASLISVYAIAEHFGIDAKYWVQDVQSRVFSTLGQPNWLSAYLVSLLPLPIYLFIYSKDKKLKTLYFSLSTLFFVSILFTKSRSGIGAMLVVLALIAAHQASKVKSVKYKDKSFLLLTFSFLLFTLSIGTPWTPTPADIKQTLDRGGPFWVWAEPYFNKVGLTTVFRPVEVAKLNKNEIEMLAAKKAGIRYGGSDSFEIRSLVWQGAIELGKRRPLFGFGPETFGYTYYNVRPAAHNLNSEWDFLYNKAHNEYLNFLANTGFLGLASYLLLLGSIIYFFLKFKIENLKFASLRPALLIGFISILITNYFGFSVVIVAVYLLLFPSLLLVSNSKNRSYFSLNINFNKSLLFTLLFILFSYLLISPINQFRADLAYNKGKVLLQYQNIKESIKYLTTATELNPQEPLFPALLAEAQASAVVAIKQQLDSLPATASASIKTQGQQMIDGFIQEATANAKKAINMNKYHTLLYKSKAKSELYIGMTKPEYNQKALDTLIELSALAPSDAKIYYNIGLLYDQLNRPTDAQLAYQQAVLLKPDYEDAKRFLANP